MNPQSPPSSNPLPTMTSALAVAAEHPSFAGHFPGFPIVPGVVLLDEALHAIETARLLDLRQWQIASAKFLEIVRPGEPLTVEHETSPNGSIRFTLRVHDRAVASGTLSAAPHAG